MSIPVVVVDDEDADRYLVKRQLGKVDDFNEPIELPTGDKFLEEFFSGEALSGSDDTPLLVLMDVNMPGRSGFETLEEAQKRIAQGRGPKSIVVMMFTSSSALRDRKRAESISIVKGYISKPLDSDGVSTILELYNSEVEKSQA